MRTAPEKRTTLGKEIHVFDFEIREFSSRSNFKRARLVFILKHSCGFVGLIVEENRSKLNGL